MVFNTMQGHYQNTFFMDNFVINAGAYISNKKQATSQAQIMK